MTLRHRIQHHPLAAFFLIAISVTWVCQILALVIAQASGMTLSNETNLFNMIDLFAFRLGGDQALAYLIFTLGAGPLIAALVVTLATGGRSGHAELWGRITKWQVGAKWYLVVFLLPLALCLISLGVAALAGGLHLASYTPLVPLAYFLPFFLYMLVFTGLAEEPGWRGVALPYLQSRYSAERSSWILGIFWGLWHVPFIFYYNLAAGMPVFALPAVLAGLIFGIVGWTIVNTWIYNSTESVFLMILLHGWYNTVNTYLVLSSQNMVAQTLNSLLPWVLAIILLRVYGKEHLAARPRPRAEAVSPVVSPSTL